MSNVSPVQFNNQSMISVEAAKAIQEIQAKLIIAKQFPRNEDEALDNILKACTRPVLAEQALYAYPKGDSIVTGPSIRMAEVLAQSWCNIDFGVRELEQVKGEGGKPGHSICQSYCWDTQRNVTDDKVFTVPHWRSTSGGGYALRDPRDIYELVANMGSRRLRACILGVIPPWVQDEAVRQVEVTLARIEGEGKIAEKVAAMVAAFERDFKVTKAMIEARLGHNLDAIIEAEMVTLRSIYKSLKDGFAKPGAFFAELAAEEPAASDKASALNDAIGTKQQPAA